ncbi:hypothetical protein [uncultured Acetobacteroides sp.]|uniref:hypothetical protein n=1 Tax=uncultured Acetobacteroides sp. TaxID=1760811 RepID=UPI0029F4F900|nr:hypothetical protein [uncultured Acetobacteroides sp.]
MRRLALFLIVSSLFFASCEKDEGDKGCVKDIAFATSSSIISANGSFTEATKYKYMVIGEKPNVSEATGVVYCDSVGVSANFAFRASRLYSNTTYYLKVFYRDASGKSVYSKEYTVSTRDNTNPTTFGKVTTCDTLIDGKELHQISYSFTAVSDYRDAEFGVCYCKATSPVPTLSDKVIKGTLGKDGVVSCDMSEVNFNEMEIARPYFKNAKETVYGPIVAYSKSSWQTCGIFPGLPCKDPSIITVNGKGYVFVGYNPDQSKHTSSGDIWVVDDMWCFDSQTFAWSKEASLNNIVSSGYRISMKTAETSKGFLFFKGGDYSGRSFNQFFSYDIANKQYTEILPNGIPENVWKYSWGSDGFSYNGKSYVVLYMGGYTNYENDPKGTFIYSYDEANRAFTLESNNPDRTGVGDVAFFRRGENIYVGSGYYTVFGAIYAQDFWSYNIATKAWTKLKDAPVKNFKRSFTYKNRCFAIDNDRNLYEYKPDSDTWVLLECIKGSAEGIMVFDSGIYMLSMKAEKKGNDFEYVTLIKKCLSI